VATAIAERMNFGAHIFRPPARLLPRLTLLTFRVLPELQISNHFECYCRTYQEVHLNARGVNLTSQIDIRAIAGRDAWRLV
jgi:hypothetical protein